nr:hypothetical protein [uncultured Gellertiella sp.]
MSQYTDAVSRLGQRAQAGDPRALFLVEFGGMVITAYDEVNDYDSLRYVKHITQGKSDTFPIIGRKRDAAEHEPGELIIGGKIEHNDISIDVDNMVYDAVFIAEIDELLNHIDVRAPYAKQLGQSLGSLQAKRIAIMHILASRKFWVAGAPVNVPQGQPAPTYFYDAAMKTSASALESAFWQAKQFLLENDMSGQEINARLPHQQVLLMARNFGLDPSTGTQRSESGSGNRVTGELGQVVGMAVAGTNHIPKTNITTGPTKYQGNFSTTVGHIGNSMAVGSLERKALQMTMKDQPERLGTLLIASQLNGHGTLRAECSIELATAVRS